MKGLGVEGGYFRVDGADLETGEESYLVLQAASIADAEIVARKQGLLIAAVRAASSADWGASSGAMTAVRAANVIEAVITFEPHAGQSFCLHRFRCRCGDCRGSAD